MALIEARPLNEEESEIFEPSLYILQKAGE